MGRKLQKEEWRSYLDYLSMNLGNARAEIEVAAEGMGDQIAAVCQHAHGVIYDPKSDSVEVALEHVDHMIRQPCEVSVTREDGGITDLEVVDGEGAHHLIKFREPLMLHGPRL